MRVHPETCAVSRDWRLEFLCHGFDQVYDRSEEVMFAFVLGICRLKKYDS